MTEDVRTRIISALLQSLYRQNYISEDVYNHSLGNLTKVLDYEQNIGYDALDKEVQADGCV